MNKEWEIFSDLSYYDMWAVRPVGDKEFNSDNLYHVFTEHDAFILKTTLEQCHPDQLVAGENNGS
jgi:hypothetical protein